MDWLRTQEAIAKIDFGKHCNIKWQTSNNKTTLKIVEADGIEKNRVRNEENSRAIEFESQIENTEEQHWTNVLGKKNDSKFVVHIIFVPDEER